MLEIRRAADRGVTRIGWLDSRHTFSFGGYLDPDWMGFSTLRVINDDRVAPGAGFGTHPHRDMEILTYVLEGALEHRDSTGTASVIGPGELQRMTAGTGVTHSEVNHSAREPVHFLQIWILPERKGLPPGYEQTRFGDGWHLAAARHPAPGVLTVHQDLALHLGTPRNVTHELAPDRHAWVHVATGDATVNGLALAAGDGLAATGEEALHLDATGTVLLFDC